MTQFAISWRLCRGRFVEAVEGMNQEQLNWRLHPGTLTLGEAAIHVAGVEVFFCSQLTGAELDEFGSRVRAASTDGAVNDKPFPFDASEITPSTVAAALELGRAMAEPLIDNPSDEMMRKELVSALGPVITGEGALARFAFHPGYHQGQAHLVKTAPGFPG